ncbi:MAG: antibiotic biosynthesis monooxygenase [Burkholderia sp.]
MLTRCAYFSGRIKPGCEARFHDHVENRLVPLWTRFPGAHDVRVLRQHHSDVGEPAFPLVIMMRFEDQAAIDAALASPARLESQIESRALIGMFDGVVFHTVFEETA